MKNSVGICALSLLVISCGGGSGDTPPDDGSAGNSPQAGAQTNTNGGLEGFVWLERDSEIFDLDSGAITVVGSIDGARPRADGLEFVTLTTSVRFADDPSCTGNSFNHFDRISIHNTASGLAVAGFEVPEDVFGVPSLSPDGQTVAGHWRNDSVCSSDETALTVWDRDGVQLIRGVPEIGEFDWLPDGRLVFEIDGNVAVETARNTLRFNTIANMGSVPGTPRALDVSADGESVVFEMTTDASSFLETVNYRESTVWRVGLDGTGLEQILSTSRTDSPQYLNSPIFSPDSTSLIVTENWVSGGVITVSEFEFEDFPIIVGTDFTPITNGSVTQVVPLAQLPIALPPQSWSADTVRPIFSREDDGQLEAARLWPLEGRLWTDTVDFPEPQRGSLPSANGRVNRGLTGNLYRFRDDDSIHELQRLSLSTGDVSIVSVPEAIDLDQLEYFAVSADESRFVIITRDILDYSFWAFDSDGSNLQSYALETDSYHLSPEEAPRFRPNSNSTVAWVYDDDNFGQSLVIFDFVAGRFGTTTGLGFIDEFDWFPNGDLLVVDGAQISRAVESDGNFSLTPIASAHTRVDSAVLSPDGQQLVVSSNRQLVLLNLEDGTRRRLTAWTDTPEVSPEFSPDGSYLAFRKLGSFDFGWPWIIAADASDVRVHDVESTTDAMRVGEGSDIDWRITRSELVWR